MAKTIYLYIIAILALAAGVLVGIVLQESYAVGTVFKKFNDRQADNTKPDEIMDESKLRLAQAKKAAQINRDEYKRVVHFYGDSIARGWGFGAFEYENRLNRIEDIAQMLLNDHGINEHELFFRFAWSQDTKHMLQELNSGMIKDGDIIVFEDAGPHEDDINKRRERYQSIKNTVRESKKDVTLVLTTMFDYWPTPPYYNSEYDALIGDSGMTMNQVVFEAAADGYPLVLDWNKQMDQAVESLRLYGISPMHRDSVHPNIFGNFLLATSLLKGIGIPISNYKSVREEFLNLPPTYYTQLGWARPINQAKLEDVLKILFKIGTSA
ncbi:MAG: SGNH/GDSL hydrolase family protein [Anaerolineae bacterium]|nr:SGNH/GDSL hydrolase family protein [Anaerolineae bacterium]